MDANNRLIIINIIIHSISLNTIDESPMAYKNIEYISDKITDTVDIVKIIKPVYNFKAGLKN